MPAKRLSMRKNRDRLIQAAEEGKPSISTS
jgi:hypothetical protein